MSLRVRLLLFAVAMVTLPGLIFAVVAFRGTRDALQREVGIQLQQTAERVADVVSYAIRTAVSDAQSWSNQDVMRDLLVGDLDKRVSRFLKIVTDGEKAYLAAVAVDSEGRVIAGSSGSWIQERRATAGFRDAGVRGPLLEPALRSSVLEITVEIPNPDAPTQSIGWLILFYDWTAVRDLTDATRADFAALGKAIAVPIAGSDGKLIGGVSFDGKAASVSTLVYVDWRAKADARGGARRLEMPAGEGESIDVVVGSSGISVGGGGWTIFVVERAEHALAPVRAIGTRWVVAMSSILIVGLALAALLARQFMRPVEEITRATSEIAARPDQPMPELEVRANNEVGQLARSFNRMTRELKRSQAEALTAEKFAFAGQLAAMVAHEVRTPLAVMRSSAQMLASERPGQSVDRAELASTIVSEVDRVNRVVDGLIQLARPVESRPVPIALADTLERAISFASPLATRGDVAISAELDAEQPAALGDPELIYQVALNLLVNALQALPAGGRIHVRTLPADDGLVGFAIEDDGPGLPDEIRERLFQPFVTGREDGTGLGLAFVDRVVKAHRGLVEVSSRAGVGASFAVRIPQVTS